MEASRSFYFRKILPAINKKFQRPLPKKSKTKLLIETSIQNLSLKKPTSKQTAFKSTKSLRGTMKYLEDTTSTRRLPCVQHTELSPYTRKMDRLLSKITVQCQNNSHTASKLKRGTQTKSYQALAGILQEHITERNRAVVDPRDVEEFKLGQQELYCKASYIVRKAKPRT